MAKTKTQNSTPMKIDTKSQKTTPKKVKNRTINKPKSQKKVTPKNKVKSVKKNKFPTPKKNEIAEAVIPNDKVENNFNNKTKDVKNVKPAEKKIKSAIKKNDKNVEPNLKVVDEDTNSTTTSSSDSSLELKADKQNGELDSSTSSSSDDSLEDDLLKLSELKADKVKKENNKEKEEKTTSTSESEINLKLSSNNNIDEIDREIAEIKAKKNTESELVHKESIIPEKKRNKVSNKNKKKIQNIDRTKLFLSSLSLKVSKENIKVFFKEVSDKMNIEIIHTRTNTPLGLAIVDFGSEELARKGLILDGEEILGRCVSINYLRIDNKNNRNERTLQKRRIKERPLPTTENKPKDLKSIYVGNLERSIPEEKIKKFFEEDGEIDKVRMKKRGGQSFGFCFIDFKDTSSVDKAIKKNKTEFEGRIIKVDFADKPPIYKRAKLAGKTTK